MSRLTVLKRRDSRKIPGGDMPNLLRIDMLDEVVSCRNAGHPQVREPNEQRLPGWLIGPHTHLERRIWSHSVV